MMGMFFYLFFLIPFSLLNMWWFMILYLMFGLFYFLHTFWFMSYYSMVSYSFGGDMLSMCLILLSFWIVALMIIASYRVNVLYNYPGEFLFVNVLLLIFLVLSFSTTNLFLFYLFFESSFIPTLFLIFGWGYQPERLSAGFYLLFYTLFASLPLLLGIFFVNSSSFSVFYFLIEVDCSIYLFISMIMAFLVKMPMIFVHFWLPSAHVEAPIAGSMILAGVLLKLGGYGLMRISNFVYEYLFMFNYVFIGLSLYGTFLVGFLCLYLVDIKSLIAYSSVAHMGLVICGIFSMNFWGLWGSLVMMIGHGLCSSGLFCLANIIYERVSSRSFIINSGLISFMPSLSLFWFILSSNNMASPPSLNLLGEIMLINSIMSWSSLSFIFLGCSSFLSCCYSIYLYSYVQHGFVYSGLTKFNFNTLREYLLIFFHLLPLNVLILSSDVLVLWL
uniref:NADH-ubiquinone oxidoreductase chain 4 n=1 Tax=Panstrongylus rufotuberculatus TaxID=156443 RepID=A0A4Y5T974_9HEMI|nr:NADH dehydrogenase subunit 4 [Panstrongylus rufotuberculatus]QDB64202.1 NADH dehydrogenase subunit 4 [Panstrongylus rufotuberculatus]